MQHRFHIRVSFFVYLFFLFGSLCALWLAINVEDLYRVVLSYIGFIFLITITITLLFLQLSKRGGISIDSNYLYIYNIPSLIVPLANIIEIEVGYNRSKNQMIIRYLKGSKVKRIGFGQVYSDSLVNIKVHIDSAISQLPDTNKIITIEERDTYIQQLKHNQESLICSFIPLIYLFLSFLVYLVDFLDSKTIIYVVFGILL